MDAKNIINIFTTQNAFVHKTLCLIPREKAVAIRRNIKRRYWRLIPNIVKLRTLMPNSAPTMICRLFQHKGKFESLAM